MRWVVLAIIVFGVAACGEPDCPTKSGYNQCGYCSEDRMTSSNPHAGMCTYCTGSCVSSCNPCGDQSGGGGCDASWVSRCGTTSGGIQFAGQPWPKSCGGCPSGTHYGGDDNVSPGGPYSICVCDGL